MYTIIWFLIWLVYFLLGLASGFSWHIIVSDAMDSVQRNNIKTSYPLPASLSRDKPVQQVQVYLFSIDGGGEFEAGPEKKCFSQLWLKLASLTEDTSDKPRYPVSAWSLARRLLTASCPRPRDNNMHRYILEILLVTHSPFRIMKLP